MNSLRTHQNRTQYATLVIFLVLVIKAIINGDRALGSTCICLLTSKPAQLCSLCSMQQAPGAQKLLKCPQVTHCHGQSLGFQRRNSFAKKQKTCQFFFFISGKSKHVAAFGSCWFGSGFYVCMEHVQLLAHLNALIEVYCISVSKDKCTRLQIQHTTDLDVNVSCSAEVARLSFWLRISQGRL